MAESFDIAAGAVVISNTAAGTNLRRGVAHVERAAAAAGVRHRLVDDMRQLEQELGESAARGVRLIIVNAGDGTVCRVLQFLREESPFPREPALALLRGGTTNMIHNDVGIPGRPETALARLADRASRGACACTERHVLRVATSTGSAPGRYGFFLATHAATKAILETRRRFHARGSTGRFSEVLSACAMAWRLIRGRVHDDPLLAPVSMEISRDGEPWREEKHVLLLAMTVRKAILGIKPLRCSQRAGMAELSWPDYRALHWMWSVLSGRLTEFQSLALRGRFSWILDGEVYGHEDADGELRISLDRPARFMVEARS